MGTFNFSSVLSESSFRGGVKHTICALFMISDVDDTKRKPGGMRIPGGGFRKAPSARFGKGLRSPPSFTHQLLLHASSEGKPIVLDILRYIGL